MLDTRTCVNLKDYCLLDLTALGLSSGQLNHHLSNGLQFCAFYASEKQTNKRSLPSSISADQSVLPSWSLAFDADLLTINKVNVGASLAESYNWPSVI